jgi:endonuclease YncB( thermonuclease family)
MATFGLGLLAGATVAPVSALRLSEPPPVSSTAPAAAAPAEVRPGYPAHVLRVLDGDTFEARVQIWPGVEVTTKVRLRSIDAPEMRARCGDERTKAEAARAALEVLLAEGGVGISRVTLDKYGGRIDAEASTRKTADVSEALLRGGFVRSYAGGRRAAWC